jgi:hypothetical protein
MSIRRVVIIGLLTAASAQLGAVAGGLGSVVLAWGLTAVSGSRPMIGLGVIILCVLLGAVIGGIAGLRMSLRATEQG